MCTVIKIIRKKKWSEFKLPLPLINSWKSVTTSVSHCHALCQNIKENICKTLDICSGSLDVMFLQFHSVCASGRHCFLFKKFTHVYMFLWRRNKMGTIACIGTNAVLRLSHTMAYMAGLCENGLVYKILIFIKAMDTLLFLFQRQMSVTEGGICFPETYDGGRPKLQGLNGPSSRCYW
jgi:hypothetical protein